MPVHFLVYVGIVVAITLLPGPDTAVVTKNALIHGRGAALGSVAGINVGVVTWTLATAAGLASVIRASATAFTTLKLIGAAYLIWLGARALWDSRHLGADNQAATSNPRVVDHFGGFRQGLFSNLANPKVALLFTSLLPQFVSHSGSAFLQMLFLGAVLLVINLGWLSTYALAAVRMSAVLTRPRVKATIDRASGVVLVGVGLKLATEHR